MLSQPGNDEALYLSLGAEMFSSAYPNHLLRWRGTREQPFGREGDRSPTPGFEIVGDLGEAGAGAEFLEHRGRLIVTTWGSEDSPAAMLQSQAIPKGGFTQAAPAVFSKVLDAGDFDPDPVIAYSWLMGAIEEYEGEIYWGIILPPGRAIQQLVLEHPTILFDAQNSIVKAHRRTHLFRTNFEDPDAPRTELLYGEKELWAYENDEWLRRPNAMGLAPLFGDAGYGEYFNDYTWTMVNYRGSLYVGTFDTSGAMQAFREDTDCYWACFILRGLAEHEPTQGRTPGFDLYRFDTPDRPPVVVTMDGFGNPANNGVRNAIVMGDELFIGSSTYSNLDTAEGSAGWELFRIRRNGRGEPSLPEAGE
ncbi:MAG: hypothetical protein GY946_12760 [bacterium]|nr:hypothetical protein [bacterium]